jgi:predicted AlkP superfamily pyrophosphatase or phosphodiesterase
MTHATLFIILDAARADYVRPDTMPFLHGLSRGGLAGSFESPPGFAQHSVVFSGHYPDTSGHFAQFVFDPENSPFKWVKGLGPLASAVKPRKVLFPARKAIQKMTEWRSGASEDPAWIPPRFLPYFATCGDRSPLDAPGALGVTSLFDLCREAGLSYRYFDAASAGGDEAAHESLARELREGGPTDLYVAGFRGIDELGHAKGPDDAALLKEHLPRLDRRLAGLHAALTAGYDTWDFFVCGAHGMAPVKRRVDVVGALREQCRAKPGKDYIVLVHSTLAAFWYLTEKGQREVEAILPRIPGTHVVGEAERTRRRVPLDRAWGDRMVAAEPGVLFSPDHFHAAETVVSGMHGYLDQRDEGHGALVLASSGSRVPPRAIGLRPLVDTLPTLCELLGLPAPQGQEGISLLKPPEVAIPQLAQ